MMFLVEFHDQSPNFGLQLHEPVQSSVDKQNFGKTVRFENPMFLSVFSILQFLRFVATSSNASPTSKTTQMLKKLIPSILCLCARRNAPPALDLCGHGGEPGWWWKGEEGTEIMAKTDDCAVHDYQLNSSVPQPEDKEEIKEPKEPARKTKDPNYKIRQAIGAPLTAQKSRNREVDQCIHEEEYLRHRASKGKCWFTCLQCGGRWERLEAAASSSTQIVETASRASYPTFLPPLRSRPDLPTHRVLVKPVMDAKPTTSTRMPTTSTLKRRGRSAERLDGLNPVQRCKTPLVGPTCKPLRTAAIEVFQMANEADPNEFDMPDFSPEEIA